jgi:hypothetical protein
MVTQHKMQVIDNVSLHFFILQVRRKHFQIGLNVDLL